MALMDRLLRIGEGKILKQLKGIAQQVNSIEDEFVARVDLKADRALGVLRVNSAWLEPGQDPRYVAGELATELKLMAGWLGLSDVQVMPRGDLAPTLALA